MYRVAPPEGNPHGGTYATRNKRSATAPDQPTYKFHGRAPFSFGPAPQQAAVGDMGLRLEREEKEWDKPPRSAHTGKSASINDPFATGTFDQAVATARRLGLAGVGLVLKPDDDITGGDLDDCVTDFRLLSPLAAEVIEYAETYAEYSPSAAGIRPWPSARSSTQEGRQDRRRRSTGPGATTITGNQIEGTPDEIRPAPRTISRLLAAVATSRGEKPKPNTNGHAKPTATTSSATSTPRRSLGETTGFRRCTPRQGRSVAQARGASPARHSAVILRRIPLPRGRHQGSRRGRTALLRSTR